MSFSLLYDNDLRLFREGKHARLYEKLGAHRVQVEGRWGCYFAVWAPQAREVSVIGDFNDWERGAHRLSPREASGIWEGFVPGVEVGQRYKYCLLPGDQDEVLNKADPFALSSEVPPATASVVSDLQYAWQDQSLGWPAAPARRCTRRRFPFTRSIWARGCRLPRPAPTAARIAIWPGGWSSTCSGWGSRTSSSCR